MLNHEGCFYERQVGKGKKMGILVLTSFKFVWVLCSIALSSGSDISTQAQLVIACTHSLFLCSREPVCAISLGAGDLALRLPNKRTTSLPEDSETEYNNVPMQY